MSEYIKVIAMLIYIMAGSLMVAALIKTFFSELLKYRKDRDAETTEQLNDILGKVFEPLNMIIKKSFPDEDKSDDHEEDFDTLV